MQKKGAPVLALHQKILYDKDINPINLINSQGMISLDNKKMRLIWSICLIVIAIGTLANVLPQLFGKRLPDAFLFFFAVCDLIAVPFLVYTSMKLNDKKKPPDTTLKGEAPCEKDCS